MRRPSPPSARRTSTTPSYVADLQTYIDLFNRDYELYGRTGPARPVPGQGRLALGGPGPEPRAPPRPTRPPPTTSGPSPTSRSSTRRPSRTTSTSPAGRRHRHRRCRACRSPFYEAERAVGCTHPGRPATSSPGWAVQHRLPAPERPAGLLRRRHRRSAARSGCSRSSRRTPRATPRAGRSSSRAWPRAAHRSDGASRTASTSRRSRPRPTASSPSCRAAGVTTADVLLRPADARVPHPDGRPAALRPRVDGRHPRTDRPAAALLEAATSGPTPSRTWAPSRRRTKNEAYQAFKLADPKA